ncbi:GDP-mannose 4,6-dehydratase [Ramlibacter sp. PS4R-6]|uniref:GDP-mannose 4,6-dehydratase n=1 Tax=Ramlibacter sp. PS4R-6 TaxID=3133438 RepID=UPI00309A963E
MKLLATGHLGFVGRAMREFVTSRPALGVDWCEPAREHDVRDRADLLAMVREHQPDWVVHLAAHSHVQASWSDPAGTLQTNAGGTANLLGALDDAGFRGRLLYVSSADVYGAVPDDQLPVDESREPAPRSPYASSKVASEVLCRQWARARPLDVVIARPFNHTGPGQREEFALPRFAKEIAAIRTGRQGPLIQAGDLEVTRDFLDVDDVVDAYVRLLRSGAGGETYNVCSGREVLLRDAVGQLLEIAGVKAEVATDPALLRPAEQRRMVGSYDKLAQATGWQPATPLRDTLARLLNHWILELEE